VARPKRSRTLSADQYVSSVSICGRPPRGRDFQPRSSESRLCANAPRVSAGMTVITFRIDGTAIQWTKNQQSLFVEPDADHAAYASRHSLMSKHRILSFKAALRLEWRGQDGQNETEQPIIPSAIAIPSLFINSDKVSCTHRDQQ